MKRLKEFPWNAIRYILSVSMSTCYLKINVTPNLPCRGMIISKMMIVKNAFLSLLMGWK
jgi:hypothetical protein